MGLIPAIVLPFNIEIIIIVIAVSYTIGSLVMQRKLAHPRKQRDLQSRLNALSKELNAIVKAKAPQDQIAAKQKELMPLMSASMKQSFKPMLVILPIFFVVYYAFIPWFAGAVGLATSVSTVKLLFFIVVFILGIISSVGVLLYDRKKTKEEKAEVAAASAGQLTEAEAKA